MANKTVIRDERIESRIDSDTKRKAQAALSRHGLSMSEYIRVIVTSVANEGLPKDFGMPNKVLTDSLMEAVNDMAGKSELPVAHTRNELEQELNE